MSIDDLNLELFEWKNGTKIQNAVVTSDGTTVQDAVWEGETPISANNLKKAQNMLALAIMQKIGLLTDLDTEANENLVSAINELANPTAKVLASPCYYMNGNQTVELSESVSSQKNGIILHWQAWDTTKNETVNSDHAYFFVPKKHVASYNNSGVNMMMATATLNIVGAKYIYVSDTSVRGNDNNSQTGTGTSGIKFNNKYWVLAQVLGV